MNRVFATGLLCAFLHLQGATCCHCRHTGAEAGWATAAAASDCCHDDCAGEHSCHLEESAASCETEDAPPCGPHHGSHLCVISHLVYVGPDAARQLDTDATGFIDLPYELRFLRSGEFVNPLSVACDVSGDATLVGQGTLLRI